MAINCYLAMTATEFASAEVLPQNPAWMACHFSCYGTGLCNLPRTLPKGAMVVVNDRTPIQGHDPGLICQQLQQLYETLQPAGFLLDFQRENIPQTAAVVRSVTEGLPCPVGVTSYYAGELDCPVFLPPPPLHVPLHKHIASFQGRELWLEAALEGEIITVTAEGSRMEPVALEVLPEPVFTETALRCQYHMDVSNTAAVFTLMRTAEDLKNLLDDAEALGITRAVGLYQQLGGVFTREG